MASESQYYKLVNTDKSHVIVRAEALGDQAGRPQVVHGGRVYLGSGGYEQDMLAGREVVIRVYEEVSTNP